MKPGYIDHGLLDNPAITDPQHDGKFKVPTLRNIAVTAPYMHNGVFRDLKTVIEFYDQYNNPQRILNPETGESWAPAEVAETINKQDLKAKKLSDAKIDALVAFLKILTDQRYEHLIKE
jgi:cytochrome c peroxidase